MSSPLSPRGEHTQTRGATGAAAGANPYASRRHTTPLQFGLTMVLLASLLLLAMAGITRYTVGEPLMPDWLAKAVHHKQPALPPGMTYDFEVLDPATKRPIEALPEVGTVMMRLAITNDSALPMKLAFRSGEQSEFIVRRVFTYVDGLFALPLEVWRSSYFHAVSPKPTALVLEPGDTKVYTATFTLNALNANQMPPGDYRVVAVLNAISTGRWETSMPLPKTL